MLFLPLEVLCKVTYPPECLPHQWIVLQEPGPRRADQSSEQFSRVPVANAAFIPRWCEAGSQRLVSSSQIRLQMMTLPSCIALSGPQLGIWVYVSLRSLSLTISQLTEHGGFDSVFISLKYRGILPARFQQTGPGYLLLVSNSTGHRGLGPPRATDSSGDFQKWYLVITPAYCQEGRLLQVVLSPSTAGVIFFPPIICLLLFSSKRLELRVQSWFSEVLTSKCGSDTSSPWGLPRPSSPYILRVTLFCKFPVLLWGWHIFQLSAVSSDNCYPAFLAVPGGHPTSRICHQGNFYQVLNMTEIYQCPLLSTQWKHT